MLRWMKAPPLLVASILVAMFGAAACTDFSTREEAGICYPDEHLDDPVDCACDGPCQPAALCVDGECLCPDPCGDRVCGTDGCGNPCGECTCGSECFDGECLYTGCLQRECGDDGCGLSCGACTEPGEKCEGGQCVLACPPDCEGKECGDDGCGGSCGICPDQTICEEGACLGADISVAAVSFAATEDPVFAETTPAAAWALAFQNVGQVMSPQVTYQVLYATPDAFDDEDCPESPTDFYWSQPEGTVPALLPGETAIFGPGLWDAVPIGMENEIGELLPLPVGSYFTVVWVDTDQMILETDECNNYFVGPAITVQ